MAAIAAAAAAAAFAIYVAITMAGRRRRKRGVNDDYDDSDDSFSVTSMLGDLINLGIMNRMIECQNWECETLIYILEVQRS